MASFVSSRDLETAKSLKKQEKREARDVLLKQAKHDHDQRKRRKELSKQRGEDTWTAPGVVKRFTVGKNERCEGRKQKRKKHYKDKAKKRLKHIAKSESSSDGYSQSDEDLWVEKGPKDALQLSTAIVKAMDQDTLKRDSWMTVPLGPSESSLTELAAKSEADIVKSKLKEKVKVSPLDNPGQHPRELNPYWKDGGCGMPEEKNLEKRSTHTGDGGRSWILRSYKRALEQADSEGKKLSEIATKRWGSLDKLHSLLRAAGIDPNNPDNKPFSKQREYLYSEPVSSRVQISKSHADNGDRNDSRGRSYQAPSSSFLMPKEMQPSSSDNSVRTYHALHENFQHAKKSRNWQTPSEKGSKEEPSMQVSCSSSVAYGDTKDSGSVQPSSASDHVMVTDPIVTDSQLNSLSAKVMKAEILGDESKASVLKAKLVKWRELKKAQDDQKSQSTKIEATNTPSETIIPLMTTDRFGRARPLDTPPNDSSARRQSSNALHSRKGKRKKYSSDDESYSLQALVEQERKLSAKDTQLAIASMASKFVSSSNTDDTIDEKYASKVAVSFDARQNEKEKIKAMYESRKLAEHLEKCKLCFGNDNFSKNLLIAVGINVYLAAPSSQSLTQGHCLLVPMEHNASMMLLDENIWEEVKVFQKGLTRMFDARGLDVIFTESCMSVNNKYHAYVECIPLPKDEGSLAPLYFKKAILESDEEWSLNRKLISTKEKGVRQSLPIGLPYFFVEFGLEGGFAHIIEDQSRFPAYFAKEVVGGMLDVEPRLWLKPPRDNFESQKRKVLELSEWWKPYDWTQKIKN